MSVEEELVARKYKPSARQTVGITSRSLKETGGEFQTLQNLSVSVLPQLYAC